MNATDLIFFVVFLVYNFLFLFWTYRLMSPNIKKLPFFNKKSLQNALFVFIVTAVQFFIMLSLTLSTLTTQNASLSSFYLYWNSTLFSVITIYSVVEIIQAIAAITKGYKK